MSRQNEQYESGNALLFILLVVALLGFLTAVISRNTSSVDQAGDIEQARIKASSLLQYTQSIETAIQNMMLQGMSVNDLDFVRIGAAYNNTNCTESLCEVFNVEGGGIPYRSPAEVLGNSSINSNWHISTANRVHEFGCDTNNSSCTELLLILSDIPKTICLQINKIQGIDNPSGDAPKQNTVTEGDAYDGTFQSSGLNLFEIGGTDTSNEAPEVYGKQAGCVHEFRSEDRYQFYHVLVAR